jgi:iron complex transport system substrate-binding protein
MSPHSIADIENDIRAVGQATARAKEAESLIARMRERLRQVAQTIRSAANRPPRVFCAEWLDPLYCSGHWVPEMVQIAGGRDLLGRKWADSVRVRWEEVMDVAPEIIIIMACGFNCAEGSKHAKWLLNQPGFDLLPAAAANRVYAVDAGYFSRPGPRIAEGTELLAHLIHPELFDWTGPSDAFSQISIQRRPALRP